MTEWSSDCENICVVCISFLFFNYFPQAQAELNYILRA